MGVGIHVESEKRISNKILSALPAAEYACFAPDLKPFSWRREITFTVPATLVSVLGSCWMAFFQSTLSQKKVKRWMLE